jgi:hypothetical protein
METNKSEIKVGDFVLIEGTLHEILAVHASFAGFSRVVRYSFCYARYELPNIKTMLDYTIDILNINKASSITEVTIPVIRATDIPKSKYGNQYEMAERLLESTLYRGLERNTTTQVSDFMINKSSGCLSAHQAASLYSPEPYGDKISIYKNAKDRKRTRRATMKPGRAFKHMLENAEDSEIASLAETYIEATAPREFILKLGTTRAHFRRAYCGVRAENRNVQTTGKRKALATSCMHTLKVETDDGEDMSPAEVFASGDFMVAWLETTDRKIAARVVFSNKKGRTKTQAPIYGACEQSINELEGYLADMEVDNVTDWNGMKVLRIDTRYGQIGPYIDCGIKGTECGDFIELCESGSITFESTDGYTSDGIYCENCNEVHQEEEMRNTPEGDLICEECFDANYIVLDCGDVCHLYEVVEAQWYCKRSNRTIYNWYHIDDAIYCAYTDEYWDMKSVTECDNGEYIPTHLAHEYPELFTKQDEE